MSRRDIVVYDLEGPISSQDNAQAVCARYVQDGDKLFPVLSRYDDLLALANKEGYEPGDTLKLLVPFLVEGGLKATDITEVSAAAGLVSGIQELFRALQGNGCSLWIISTSYQQHALYIAEQVGLSSQSVYSTPLPLDRFRVEMSGQELEVIRAMRQDIVQLYDDDLESGVNDQQMQPLLNPFYWEHLPKTELGQQMAEMQVMGGRRKVAALEDLIRLRNSHASYLSNVFVVGDSITDFRMLQVVEAAGGVAVAWNANQYAIPWATCGVAAVEATATQPLIDAWVRGGRTAVRSFVESTSLPSDPETGPFYHWLAGTNHEFREEMVLPIHRRLRTLCRGTEVAKLG